MTANHMDHTIRQMADILIFVHKARTYSEMVTTDKFYYRNILSRKLVIEII